MKSLFKQMQKIKAIKYNLSIDLEKYLHTYEGGMKAMQFYCGIEWWDVSQKKKTTLSNYIITFVSLIGSITLGGL